MTEAFSSWAILEIMGHRVRAGYVREVEIAGSKLLRIDVLVGKDDADQDVMVTEYYGAGAVYALRPCSEEIVRDNLKRYAEDPRPVRPLEYREREVLRRIELEQAADEGGSEMPF